MNRKITKRYNHTVHLIKSITKLAIAKNDERKRVFQECLPVRKQTKNLHSLINGLSFRYNRRIYIF